MNAKRCIFIQDFQFRNGTYMVEMPVRKHDTRNLSAADPLDNRAGFSARIDNEHAVKSRSGTARHDIGINP